ncbi:hypothetical protein MMC28_008834 [Mycoblastus sanguinarius]|nr:hypothetical protein [Mycoblastus sanguinarius]
MAPTRTKKARLSTDNISTARPQLVATKSPTRTPIQSPQKKATRITEIQKQALIDNLQLESKFLQTGVIALGTNLLQVTERARKLRAQYALQAQSLRTRIELRINRIPTSLRKANMGELYEKYLESESKQKEASEEARVAAPAKETVTAEKAIMTEEGIKSTPAPKTRGTKRTRYVDDYLDAKPSILNGRSDDMESADKENAQGAAQTIPIPKKRTKVGANPRQDPKVSTVLSPKSANSRTLPQSPVRPELGSPQKPYLSRPVSPLKPISPIKSVPPAKAAAAAATASLAGMVNEKTKVGRPKATIARKTTNSGMTAKPAATRAKRGAIVEKEPEHLRNVSNTSNISSASTGTTVVRNAGKGNAAAARKKNDVEVKAVGKKVAVGGAEGPPLGRRVLRKRA